MSKIDINHAGYHMGHLFIDLMRRSPDSICQIDAATGEEETNASVLSRSVRLARSFRRLGLTPGDVLALGGNNHLDLHIPYYAALMNGLPIVGVNPMHNYDEIKALFQLTEPRIAFCQHQRYEDYIKVASELGLQTQVVTFDGEHSLSDFLAKYGDDSPIDDFQPAMFDLDKIYAWLVSTGGTTGVLKLATVKHKVWLDKVLGHSFSFFRKEITAVSARRNALNIVPVNWISGVFHPISMAVLNQTRVQTSAPLTVEHLIDIINTYKPATLVTGPALASSLLRQEKYCDYSCLSMFIITGSKVFKDILIGLKEKLREDAVVLESYGQTENLCPVFEMNPKGPIGSCGKRNDALKIVKLMDLDTGKEIVDPHSPGELWTKGAEFSGYYKNPEATAAAFTEDGWFKTRDILYRDEEDNFYFVERLNMAIRYRGHRIIPMELEEVIREHPGVEEVSVTCVAHVAHGEMPVACVVRSPGGKVSAQDIKNLVADKLSDYKQLRGGVVFLEQLPMTSTGKVARGKLRHMVVDLHKE